LEDQEQAFAVFYFTKIRNFRQKKGSGILASGFY